jgi:putative FmdB family regulatory protein
MTGGTIEWRVFPKRGFAMPIYAYRCSACGHAQDVLQKISDPLLTVCPACGQSTYAKQVTAAGFQLKGSGWYVTDFRDGAKGAKKAGADKADDAGADKSGAPADAKSEAKADAAPAKAPDAGAAAPAAAPAPAPAAPAAGG